MFQCLQSFKVRVMFSGLDMATFVGEYTRPWPVIDDSLERGCEVCVCVCQQSDVSIFFRIYHMMCINNGID